MTLPKNWRTIPSDELEEMLETVSVDQADADDIIEELSKRDAQALANAGAMNGIAPEHDFIDDVVNDWPLG